MEEYSYLILPLYQDSDYYYIVNIEGIAYKFRFYYNLREERWAIDIRYANNDPIILGAVLLPDYPNFIDHEMPFSGFLYLEAIPQEKNETVINPFDIWKYYRLYYGSRVV